MSEGPSAPKAPSTPKDVPKPYTTPDGYKAPAMSELWLYVGFHLLQYCFLLIVALCCAYEPNTKLQANKAHPYYRYGYSLALGVGLAAAAYAMLRDPVKPQTARDRK